MQCRMLMFLRVCWREILVCCVSGWRMSPAARECLHDAQICTIASWRLCSRAQSPSHARRMQEHGKTFHAGSWSWWRWKYLASFILVCTSRSRSALPCQRPTSCLLSRAYAAALHVHMRGLRTAALRICIPRLCARRTRALRTCALRTGPSALWPSARLRSGPSALVHSALVPFALVYLARTRTPGSARYA
jgi:hypothetical protein